MSNTITLTATVNGASVEIVCYGTGQDYVCRLTDGEKQPKGRVVDSYYPPADLGFLWLREHDCMWLVSGMVNGTVMADAESIDQMIYKIMEEGLGLHNQVASCVEIVEVKQTSIFNGEEGFLFFDGGGDVARWGKS